MAFLAASLSIVSANDPQLFKYKTDDQRADVMAAGYFNSATARLHKGDLILVSGDLSGAVFVEILCVTSATAAATVTVIAPVTV